MKKYIAIIIVVLLVACTSESKKEKSAAVQSETKKEKSASIQKVESKGTYLCKINGEDWEYTKVSGMVSYHKIRKTKTAFITFRKQMENGSEAVQLRYDAYTNKIAYASFDLKRLDKEGNKKGVMYILDEHSLTKYEGTKMSGTIVLDPNKGASGTADLILEAHKHDSAILKPEDVQIRITDLEFKGVGYSDL